MRVHLVAGARPNFMKVAPLHRELAARPWCVPIFVHTGQHRDPAMSDSIMRELGLPEPDLHLGAGTGSHAEQTASVLVAYERACLDSAPDVVIVVGDVNSTLAAALAARKLGLPVVHLEAGLRCGDETMPEEINRRLTDALADLLWTHSPQADLALLAEGVPADRIVRVGNIMVDSLRLLDREIRSDDAVAARGLSAREYIVVTIHRPANVDDRATLEDAVRTIRALSERAPVVLPLHPRTSRRLHDTGAWDVLANAPRVLLEPPLPYRAFAALLMDAAVVVTDSGGVQEETTALGVPCVTVRPTTERSVTIVEGTNCLAEWREVPGLVETALAGDWPIKGPPSLWDGRTAARCADSLWERFGVKGRQ